MREIKFRAYDTHTKTMLPIVDIIKFTKSEDIYITRHGAYGVGINIQYQPSIKLMQYIGLKDKNGKEIYEGDIVLIEVFNYQEPEWSGEFEVTYSEDLASYILDDLEDISNFKTINTIKDYYHYEIEIIGNIYENKDVLEGK